MLLRLVIAYSCVFFQIIGFIANAKEILEQFVASLTMLLLVSLRYDASFLRCVVLGENFSLFGDAGSCSSLCH